LDADQDAQLEELDTAEDDLRAVEDDLRNGKVEKVSEALVTLPGAHQRKRMVLLATGERSRLHRQAAERRLRLGVRGPL